MCWGGRDGAVGAERQFMELMNPQGGAAPICVSWSGDDSFGSMWECCGWHMVGSAVDEDSN